MPKRIIIALRDGSRLVNDPALGHNLTSVEDIKVSLKVNKMYRLWLLKWAYDPVVLLRDAVVDVCEGEGEMNG